MRLDEAVKLLEKEGYDTIRIVKIAKHRQFASVHVNIGNYDLYKNCRAVIGLKTAQSVKGSKFVYEAKVVIVCDSEGFQSSFHRG